MNLREIIPNLERHDDGLCIVAKRPWSPVAQAKLVRLGDDFSIPVGDRAESYEYFLEVAVALDDVLDGVRERLSPEQCIEAVIFYAENDAYPEWLCDLREDSK